MKNTFQWPATKIQGSSKLVQNRSDKNVGPASWTQTEAINNMS